MLDFDDRFDRDCEREPTYSRTRTKPRLVATGSLRQHFVCTQEEHELAKSEQWDTLKPIGMMPAFNDGAPHVLELANCTKCNSTLAREMPPATDAAVEMLRREGLI